MIAYLNGKLALKTPTLVHLDVNGVGSEVHISLHTWSQIQGMDNCKLLTYVHIKEDAHTMYGFFSDAERTVFLQLLSVSGVGASTARMMPSTQASTAVWLMRLRSTVALGVRTLSLASIVRCRQPQK